MKTITPHELVKILDSDKGLNLIDVRTPAEFSQIHVPQAVNYPLDSLKPVALFKSGALKESDPIYILCHSGNRAKSAAESFNKAGYSHTIIVEGGTKAWAEAGLPVTRGQGKVISLERQVRIAAGSLVLAGVLLSLFIHPYFLIISAFVGCGLIFAGVTDWCGMALILGKMPWNKKSHQ